MTTEQALQRTFPDLRLKFVVVDHSLEGWLLQDREAIRQCLGRQARLGRYSNPEDNCRPVELLAELFYLNGQVYAKTQHTPKIARSVDIKRISRASPTFRTFQQAVQD